MKYFIDTEFLEGTQKGWFGKTTKPTIDLISVGIVCEDDREYYAISKDFNLKEAWSRYDKVKDGFRDYGMTPNFKKVYWIRENVLKPIYNELALHHASDYKNPHLGEKIDDGRWLKFNYKSLKWLIGKYGKSNKQIAEEILYFCSNTYFDKTGFDLKEASKYKLYDNFKPEFYGYYSDYDWVVFCWLFGKMIDLPKGFPMFAFDIQQQIEEYNIDKKLLLENIPQINCHNSLQDAIWNFKAYQYIQNKIENGGKRST